MHFELTCPACGKTTALAAPPPTPVWTCACGAAFDLDPPEAQAEAVAAVSPPAAGPVSGNVAGTVAERKKSCPECGAFIPDANVLCTECGYNFQRGSKVVSAAGGGNLAAAPDPEVLAREERRRHRLRLILAAVLVFALGGGLYWAVTAKDYGISGRHPMGKTASLEKHFTGNMRLAVDDPARPVPAAFGLAGTMVVYKDVLLEKETNGRFQQTMTVAYDANHDICGVSGTFPVWSSAIPGGGTSRISGFLKDYWEEVGAPVPPVFQRRTIGEGMFQHQEEVAEFTRPGVRAVWRRSGCDGMGMISSIDTITVVRAGADPAALAADADAEEEAGAGLPAPAAEAAAPTGEE